MLRLKPRQSVDCWSERPGLLLPQPQQAGDAPPGTDEDDEREQPHSQTPGKACLRLDNVGGSRWIPGGRSAGLGWRVPAIAVRSGHIPFQSTWLARALIHHRCTFTTSRVATGRRGLEDR